MQTTTDVDQERARLLTFIGELERFAARAKLPEPPASLTEARRQLEENETMALVCGETDRGKSSFINALLGHALLPVRLGAETAQAFCVRRGEREAYRLRYDDDSTRSISEAQMLEILVRVNGHVRAIV